MIVGYYHQHQLLPGLCDLQQQRNGIGLSGELCTALALLLVYVLTQQRKHQRFAICILMQHRQLQPQHAALQPDARRAESGPCCIIYIALLHVA